MSKTLFTPGPYRVVDLRHQKKGQILIVSDARTPDVSDYEIAKVLARNPRAAANARLILNAPELFDMTKTFLEVIDALDRSLKPHLKNIESGSIFDLRAARAAVQRLIAEVEGDD